MTINYLLVVEQMVIYPKDIEKLKAFYTTKQGFVLQYRFGVGPVKGYQLQTSGIALTLLSIENAPKTAVNNFMLHIKVADIEACYKKVKECDIHLEKDIENTD